MRLTISRRLRQALARQLHTAPQFGQGHDVRCRLALLAVADGDSGDDVARTRRVTPKTVHQWVHRFRLAGRHGLTRRKPPGRPPRRTKTPKHAWAERLDAGPVQAGLASGCWRAPMRQPLLDERFGVFSNVFSSAPVLHHLGFRDQKAAVVAAHRHDEKRRAWCTTTGPQILTHAPANNAWLWCGDEASVPPWGTRSSTWARGGHHPMVKTSGTRTGDKVFGVIDDCTGRFFDQGQEGRRNSEAYSAFLPRVLEPTQQHMIRLHDGARYHTSAAMQAVCAAPTEHVTVFQLPSYAPDDHPREKLWKQGKKDGTPVPYVPTCEALRDQVEHALLKFANTPAEILAWCSLPTELAQAASMCLSQKIFFLKAIGRGCQRSGSPLRETDALVAVREMRPAWERRS